MAGWDDSRAVFLLKAVKMETEGTHTHTSLFSLLQCIWVQKKKKPVIRSSKCASSAGD